MKDALWLIHPLFFVFFFPVGKFRRQLDAGKCGGRFRLAVAQRAQHLEHLTPGREWPAIGSFVTSIIFTVKARRYRAVLAIGIVHILFLAAIVLVIWRQSGEGASETPVDIAIMSYGVFFTAVAIWWFSAGKRRMIKASVPSQ